VADRPQELALKKDLVVRMVESTTDAIRESECVVTRCFPEAVAHFYNPDPARYYEVDLAAGRMFVQTQQDWSRSEASVASIVSAYFPEDPIGGRWERFTAAVSSYIRLGSTECGRARLDDMAILRDYFPGMDSSIWRRLLRGLGPQCVVTPEDFTQAYLELGDRLERERGSLVRDILQANAAGYSAGWGDFLEDLYPL
jgi:hypothetical protein